MSRTVVLNLNIINNLSCWSVSTFWIQLYRFWFPVCCLWSMDQRGPRDCLLIWLMSLSILVAHSILAPVKLLRIGKRVTTVKATLLNLEYALSGLNYALITPPPPHPAQALHTLQSLTSNITISVLFTLQWWYIIYMLPGDYMHSADAADGADLGMGMFYTQD